MKQREHEEGQKDEFMGFTMTSHGFNHDMDGLYTFQASNESKITQFEVLMKNIRPREAKRGFSKTPHVAPLNVCAFLVYLVDSNDSNIDVD